MDTTEITNSQDYLYSQDIEDRITALKQAVKDSKAAKEPITALADELEELEGLLKLKEQYIDYFGENSWNFGAQFIRYSYFEDYTREFAGDCGLITDDMKWPATHIDWKGAARELQMDWTEIDFNGVTYWTHEA